MLEAALFPIKLASNFFYFMTVLLHFMLNPGSNPVPKTEPVSVPLRQKVAVPAVPVPDPVPQH